MSNQSTLLWFPKTWTTIVDYRLDIVAMLNRCGLQTNPDITAANFPRREPYTGIVQFEVTLCKPNSLLETRILRQEIEYHGYTPGTIELLVAAITQHPELLTNLPIFAVGSVGRDGFGDPAVPYVGMIGPLLSLRLYSPLKASVDPEEWAWKPEARFITYSRG